MSYTPTEWTTGDVITAEKLNKIENGIANVGGSSGGGALVVHQDNQTGALDKTWQEIADAAPMVWIANSNNPFTNYVPLTSVIDDSSSSREYGVRFVIENQRVVFITDSPSGYPVLDNSGLTPA